MKQKFLEVETALKEAAVAETGARLGVSCSPPDLTSVRFESCYNPCAMAPTIVLVPASFTPADVYTSFLPVLQKHGFGAVTVSLPSVGLREDSRAPGTMLDDAAEIARVVADLYDKQGKEEVILLTHSYGGIPASESMKFVSAKNRARRERRESVGSST